MRKGSSIETLKPANIKLTQEGKVKILDFGLAKALEDPVSNTESVTSGNYDGPAITVNWTAATPAGQKIPGRCVWKTNADYTAGTGECHSSTDGKWWHQRRIKTTRIK